MKGSGETKLLLILGLIVILGGGIMFGLDKWQPPPPTPRPTPKPFAWDAPTFDKIAVGAPHIHDVPSPTLTVVEFADFQCPSCRKAYDVLLRKLKQEKSVRFIFHHLPLVGMHERAMPAAMAAEAADKQGKFWEMYDALFDGLKTELTDDDIDKCARKAGLDMTKFKNDLNDSASRARIEADLKMAASYHIGSTPTFVVKDSKDAVFQVVGAQELQAALVREGIAL